MAFAFMIFAVAIIFAFAEFFAALFRHADACLMLSIIIQSRYHATITSSRLLLLLSLLRAGRRCLHFITATYCPPQARCFA